MTDAICVIPLAAGILRVPSATADASDSHAPPTGGRSAVGEEAVRPSRHLPLVMLILLGTIWGLVVPLSAIAMAGSPHPLGLSSYVHAIGAVAFIGLAGAKGRLARLDLPRLRYFATWAAFSVLGQALLFWLAHRVPSSTIALIVILDGFMVFALASLLRLERPTLKRLAGLAAGFLGLAVVLHSSGQASGAGLVTLLVLGVPLCYAAENLLVAARWPAGVDPLAGLGLMQAIAALLAFGLALLVGDMPILTPGLDRTTILVFGIGLCSAAANWLFQALVTRCGSVFTSQSSYVVTLAGIGWSVLLLGEVLPATLWIALAAIGLGLFLVKPGPGCPRAASLANPVSGAGVVPTTTSC